MQFRKYQDIDNSDRKKTLDFFFAENATEGRFVVQEKAHGANLSFWYDGAVLQSAKRGGFIDGDFYNYKPVEERNAGHVKRAWELLKEKGLSFEIMAVYGELIGGTYPHPDVERDKGATKVQKGIFYSPRNEFYAIDLALDYQFVDIETFEEIMEKSGFLYAKTLFSGTFQECLEHSNQFPSKIPEWLGLPPIDGNVCEGVVIKPAQPRILADKSRAVLKNKNEKWAEKAMKRDRQSKPPVELSQEAADLLAEMESLVVENRLRNVLSKFGPVKDKDFGTLIQLFSADVLEDFGKDHEGKFESLQKSERKQLTKTLGQSCAYLIRMNFRNILDGEF